MTLVGKTFAKRFHLTNVIGEGGTAFVYRAYDSQQNTNVAVKILKHEYNNDREFLNRFHRESEVASSMQHPNLVNLILSGEEAGCHYIVMEYVHGHTLKDYIQTHGRLECNTAVYITLNILKAIQCAHEHGVIHRDIKPQNVLIDSDFRIKVSDFGIARLVASVTLGDTNSVVGSLHYSSPEQLAGEAVHETGDIYSAGIVLYEMLTGHVPFSGDTIAAVISQHATAKPAPIEAEVPDTPEQVIAAVMKAMEKKPEDRYQSADEMAKALQNAIRGKLVPKKLGLPVLPDSNPEDSVVSSKKSSKLKPKIQRKKRHFTRILVSCVASLFCLALISFAVYRIYYNISRVVIAPDIVGLSTERAQKELGMLGLVWQQTESYHDTVPAGTVISQVPSADEELVKGDSIVATISKGPALSVAPNVIGLDYNEATAQLIGAGFTNVVVIKTVSNEPVGQVISQTPNKEEAYAAGQAAEITVSGGNVAVPELIGRTEENALTLLSENMLAGTVEYIETPNEEQVGLVISQKPDGDSLVVQGAAISVCVGIESKPYHAEISLSIPALETETTLSVLISDDEEEMNVFERKIGPCGETAMLIPVTSSQQGECDCRIYLNEQLYMTQHIVLR